MYNLTFFTFLNQFLHAPSTKMLLEFDMIALVNNQNSSAIYGMIFFVKQLINKNIMSFNNPINTHGSKHSTYEALDKKQLKPIIPKIKASSSIIRDTASQSTKKQSEVDVKIQKTSNNSSIPYKSTGQIKNFPKEEELQKMTQKELAQTYYAQFLRLRRQNEVLDKQLAFVRNERDMLYKRFNELKDEQMNFEDMKPRRQRRVASQIARKYTCPAENCSRSYGSEGSLIQHIKIKHPQFYLTPSYYSFLNKYEKQEQSS